MWVSKKTRYGLRLLVELAINYGKLITLKEVSRREGISGKYLEQIVSDLKKAGLVEAQRGTRGGYRLIKDPREITMEDIISIFEGDSSIVECLNDPLLCERSGFCRSRDLWAKTDQRINESLRAINLLDVTPDLYGTPNEHLAHKGGVKGDFKGNFKVKKGHTLSQQIRR